MFPGCTNPPRLQEHGGHKVRSHQDAGEGRGRPVQVDRGDARQSCPTEPDRRGTPSIQDDPGGEGGLLRELRLHLLGAGPGR